MKRSKTFMECDDLVGWDDNSSTGGTDDRRLKKHLRPHQVLIANMKMTDVFEVGDPVSLPPSVMAESEGRGDLYEAFWRSSYLSFRGVFVNSEPAWGHAEYRNGMSYTGMFKGGVPHGFGEKRSNESVYKGRFENGSRHGRGMLFDSLHFRLYNGKFENDKPQGMHMCILFCWCKKKKRVEHTRSLLTFDHGVLVLSEKATKVNVSDLNGMSPEEFLQTYRECEKALEQKMQRYRLRQSGAEPVLWMGLSEDIENVEVANPIVVS
jgi:hypothetical protein